ncbi:cullin binding [Ceratobasidium sp. AG-Ba]|nr:cullin binding [Ceratobasidium sp. AG-Ba]
MPPKRKATEAAAERTTKSRRGGAKEAPPAKPAKASAKKATKSEKAKSSTADGLDPSSFTLEGVQTMFDRYMDEDDNDVIGGEGLERLCGDASMSMEGALPLLVAWSVNAKTLGSITRTEFADAFGKLRIDTPQKVGLMASDLNTLFFDCSIAEKAARMSINNGANGADPYDRTLLRSYQHNAESAYSKFYSFCFALVKPPQSRNIDMETATAFWSAILAPKYPIAGELVAFISEKGTYKAVTKDIWSMTLEFCKTVQPDLQGYDEEEAAWPSLLDDFVEWKKAKLVLVPTEDAMVE